MALKDILLVLDDHPRVDARIDAAAALAARHDGHLTGLYVVAPVVFPAYLETEVPESLRRLQAERDDARVKRARTRFLEGVERAGLGARSELRCAEGAPTETVARQARTCDVVVIGQTDPDHSYDHPHPSPHDLIFACGRPTLAIPYVGRYPTIGDRVLIAWNGSREAARAVADAMPILTMASQVTVLMVGPSGETSETEMARHLSHHGVKVEGAHTVADHQEIGDILLNQVSDLGCDLIVMGAYGHSRLRTLVLGSLTSHLLAHMTVPVLMSH